MSEETTAPEAVEPQAWLGVSRQLSSVSANVGSAEFRVYFNGVDKFDLTFGTPGGSLSASIWTDEAGLEAVIEECRFALQTKRNRP